MRGPHRSPVHPILARRVADHMSTEVWRKSRLTQVCPGVFVHPECDWVVAVIGAAPISEVAEDALRSSGLMSEILVLQSTSLPIEVYGPASLYTLADWHELSLLALAQTRDVEHILSKFEVVYAQEQSRLACLCECSEQIAAALPFGASESREERQSIIKRGGWEYVEEYEKAVKALVQSTPDSLPEGEAA